jgi:hypothetical protein
VELDRNFQGSEGVLPRFYGHFKEAS